MASAMNPLAEEFFCWPNQGVVSADAKIVIETLHNRQAALAKALAEQLAATEVDSFTGLNLPTYLRTKVPVSEYPLTGIIPPTAYWVRQNDMIWREWISPEDRAARNELISENRNPPLCFVTFSGLMLELPPGFTAMWFTRAGMVGPEARMFYQSQELTKAVELQYALKAIYRHNNKRFNFVGIARSDLELGGSDPSDRVTAIRQGTVTIKNTTKSFLQQDDYILPIALEDTFGVAESHPSIASIGAAMSSYVGSDDDVRGRWSKFNPDHVDEQRYATDNVLAFLGRPYYTFDGNSYKHIENELCIPSVFVRASSAEQAVQPPHRMAILPDDVNTGTATVEEEIGGGFVQCLEELAMRAVRRIIENALDPTVGLLVRGPAAEITDSVDALVSAASFMNVTEGRVTYDTNIIRDEIFRMFGGPEGSVNASPSAQWFAASVVKCYRSMMPPIYGKVIVGGPPGSTICVNLIER
jgi:hypothetical protein